MIDVIKRWLSAGGCLGLLGCGVVAPGGGSETGFVACDTDADCEEGSSCVSQKCVLARIEDERECTAESCPDDAQVPPVSRDCIEDGDVGADARWVALVTQDGAGSRLLQVGAEGVSCPRPVPVIEYRVLWALDGSALSTCGFDTGGPATVIPFADDAPQTPIVLTDACTAHDWSPTAPVLATCEPSTLSHCVLAEMVDGTLVTRDVQLPGPVENGAIAWSPSGGHVVAFHTRYEAPPAAFLIDARDALASPTALVTSEGSSLGITCQWSPSGNRLACGVPTPDFNCRVAVLDVTEDAPTAVTIPGASCQQQFGFVNDQWLVYGGDALFAVELRDGAPQEPTQIHAYGAFNQWSATSGNVAVTGPCGGGTGLCVIPFTDAGPSPGELIRSGSFSLPAWSPGNGSIKFAEGETMHLVNRDGAGLVQLAPDINVQLFWNATGEWLQVLAGSDADREVLHVPTLTRSVVGANVEGDPELATFSDDLSIVVVPLTRHETSDTMLAVSAVQGAQVATPELTRIEGEYYFALIRPRAR